MLSITRTCPIRESAPSAREFDECGLLQAAPSACGRFPLLPSGASLLRSLTDRRSAKPSCRIRLRNLRNRLFDASPEHGEAKSFMDQA